MVAAGPLVNMTMRSDNNTASSTSCVRARQRIQGAERFVHQQHARFDRQRPRNAHALALPAGKGVRIALGRVGRQANLVDQLGHPPAQGITAGIPAMHDQGLGDGLEHGVARVQAGGRLLENDADPPPAHPAHGAFRQAVQVFAVQVDLPADDAAGVRQQTQQRQRRDALAASGFADQRKGLPLGDGQLQALDRVRHAAFAGDVDIKALHIEQRRVVAHGASPDLDGRGSAASAGAGRPPHPPPPPARRPPPPRAAPRGTRASWAWPIPIRFPPATSTAWSRRARSLWTRVATRTRPGR
ncbi:hypothetical protein G6F22_014723 [Rhizopus arrhizus]|nr:hypothetical protein G6F22_014723 [Rhizopus arrhizus]